MSYCCCCFSLPKKKSRDGCLLALVQWLSSIRANVFVILLAFALPLIMPGASPDIAFISQAGRKRKVKSALAIVHPPVSGNQMLSQNPSSFHWPEQQPLANVGYKGKLENEQWSVEEMNNNKRKKMYEKQLKQNTWSIKIKILLFEKTNIIAKAQVSLIRGNIQATLQIRKET